MSNMMEFRGMSGYRPPGGGDDPHGIRLMMEEAGVPSISALARAIGVNKNRLNSLFALTRTGRTPSGYALDKAVEFLKVEIERKRAHERGERGSFMTTPGAQLRRHASIRHEAPVFPCLVDGVGYRLAATPLRYVRLPEIIETVPDVFGVVLRDPEMTPMFRPGDTLILNPQGVPQPGAGVAVMGPDKQIAVREYLDEDAARWTLRRHGHKPSVEKLDKSGFPHILTVAVVYPGR